MSIEYGKERLVIAEMVLAIMKARARHYYPELGIASSYDLQLLATAVFIGHMAKRPMGASSIARMAGMPRATALRRLDVLIQRGLVLKKGRIYSINPEGVNGPQMAAIVRENTRLILAAAKKLSKMDENR